MIKVYSTAKTNTAFYVKDKVVVINGTNSLKPLITTVASTDVDEADWQAISLLYKNSVHLKRGAIYVVANKKEAEAKAVDVVAEAKEAEVKTNPKIGK